MAKGVWVSLLVWSFALGLVILPQPLYAVDHFYGVVDGGILIRLETDETPVFQLHLLMTDKLGNFQVLNPAVRLEPTTDNTSSFKAVNAFNNSVDQVNITFADKRAVLKWLQPRRLKCADGTVVEIAGDYPLVPDTKRKLVAEQQFKGADQELNEIYSRLRRSMPNEEFVKLRNNQRDWLKYRDHFIADDDNWLTNGPGSIPFLQQQTMRTRERIGFLQTLLQPMSFREYSSSLYSDGITWELCLGAVPRTGEQRFFTLQNRFQGPNNQEEGKIPQLVIGQALPTEQRNLLVLRGEARNNSKHMDHSQLMFLLTEDQWKAQLSNSSQPPLNISFFRMADLSPAKEPMRDILLRLPVETFDNTTEGLSMTNKMRLVMTGNAESFYLQEQGLNFLRIGYPEGQVDLCRFPAVDGGAVIGVSTTNVRARYFELWKISTNNDIPEPWPLERALPRLQPADFYRDTGSVMTGEGHLDFSLQPNIEEITVSLFGRGNQQETDVTLSLVWDGYRFSAVRSIKDY